MQPATALSLLSHSELSRMEKIRATFSQAQSQLVFFPTFTLMSCGKKALFPKCLGGKMMGIIQSKQSTNRPKESEVSSVTSP